MSFEFTMTNLEVTKADLILHNVVALYREEAVERVHVLPITPRQLPSIRRTVHGGKNVFIKNMNNVVAYYQTAVKRLDSSGHTQEAKDLGDRRLRLKDMIDGLNFNMIAVLILMDQRLGTLDEDARYAVIGRFPAFEDAMSEQLPSTSVTQEQQPDVVPFTPQYPPTPSSTAETPIPQWIDESESMTAEGLENQFQNNVEISLDHGHAAPLIFTAGSVDSALEPTPESTTAPIPEEPEQSNSSDNNTAGSQRPALKRSFDDMDEQESEEEETLDDDVEYEEVTDDEDEVIIITEEPEEGALLPLPETTAIYDQTLQGSKGVDLSSQTAQKEDSQDDNIENKEVADEEEETIIITEETEVEDPLPSSEIRNRHEQRAQQGSGSEAPSSAVQENSTGAKTNECPSLSILLESEYTNEGILQHLGTEEGRQDPEETTDNNDDVLTEVEIPVQLHDAPESISSVSPASEHSSKTVADYLAEESPYEWGSSLNQEDLAFLDDFLAAEEFLASSSDEEDDTYPVKVMVVPVSMTVENVHHTEAISDQESVLSQAAEGVPSSEESTLLNEDEVIEEEKTENEAVTNENGDGNHAAGTTEENTEAAATETPEVADVAETAKTAETAETVPAVDEKLEAGVETEDEPDTTKAPVPTQESEEVVDSYETTQWSLRGILGTVAAIGVPMAIIYPTFTAVVLFGMIRYARSRL